MYATIIIIITINDPHLRYSTYETAASVMNPHVPHTYLEFIMHTMVDYTHTTFMSAQNATEKARLAL